ncbi:phosphodiester glycosidase family protein [Demequina subtropica]|uniref:phosphodiester glycosidase family protein n=1 Tax=Demequina subtropica TaxID=1638989 RepID=UPI00078188A6|nr:phosphodiester glycosidase family protein [Demequina subtropica]
MDTSPRPRRRRWRVAVASIAGLLALVAGVVGWALDRYVIDHVEIADASAYEASLAEAADTTADDGDDTVDDAQITLSQHTYGTGEDAATYYVAEILLTDITQLRSAFADDAFGENIIADPSEIAEQVGAALAINGDYYGFRSDGIEIRNGVVYRDEPAREGAVIYRDGTMEVYDETTTSAEELLDAGAWQTLSFGPALVDDGAVVDGIDQVEVDTNVGNHSIQGDQPRTAIGMIEANHYVLVVVDGRSDTSAGVTLDELAQIMIDLGATEAYNLDGGGSSTMVSDGDVVNVPGGRGRERGTSDILWVG